MILVQYGRSRYNVDYSKYQTLTQTPCEDSEHGIKSARLFDTEKGTMTTRELLPSEEMMEESSTLNNHKVQCNGNLPKSYDNITKLQSKIANSDNQTMHKKK